MAVAEQATFTSAACHSIAHVTRFALFLTIALAAYSVAAVVQSGAPAAPSDFLVPPQVYLPPDKDDLAGGSGGPAVSPSLTRHVADANNVGENPFVPDPIVGLESRTAGSDDDSGTIFNGYDVGGDDRDFVDDQAIQDYEELVSQTS